MKSVTIGRCKLNVIPFDDPIYIFEKKKNDTFGHVKSKN